MFIVILAENHFKKEMNETDQWYRDVKALLVYVHLKPVFLLYK